jgi:NADH-quinone oxidoreductase subunit G
MFEQPRKAYLLLNVEPEYDCANPALAKQALQQAEFVVALTPFKSDALTDADVLLPIAPFTETSGTFMSMEGRVQSFAACVRPLGETRPAWKVLRVLANMLGLAGFDYESSEQVKDELFGGEKPSKVVWNRLNNNLTQLSEVTIAKKIKHLQRLGEVPPYMVDNVVRRAPALQKTKKSQQLCVSLHPNLMKKLKLNAGDLANISQDGATISLPVQADAGLPENTVRVPAGRPETVALGDMMGEIEVSKA